MMRFCGFMPRMSIFFFTGGRLYFIILTMKTIGCTGGEDMVVTMQDVAQSAGVDKATVSRVLRGDPRISEKTKLRVMESVRSLDYRPDRNARNLSTNRSGLVGVVLRCLSAPWFSPFAAGLERTFSHSDYELMFKCTDGDPCKSVREFRRLCDRRAEGVIWQDPGNVPENFPMPFITLGFKRADSYSILFDSPSFTPVFETGVLTGRLMLNIVSGKPVPSRELLVRSE